MIDSHCHLEWKDFDPDRDKVIGDCRKGGLKAIVTSCARLADLEKSLGIVKKHRGFVFMTAGLHPEFVKDISEKDVEGFMDFVKENEKGMVGIGECGLDYHWVKESRWQEKQKEMFKRILEFAEEVKKPVVVHSREASQDTIRILEDSGAKILWHMFTDRKVLPEVMGKEWMISINTLILRSKDVRKIARDMPLERILLETDSPWLGPEGKRNTPLSIRDVAEKIAEIKKLDFERVWEQGGKGAVNFFSLPVKL